MLSLELAKKIKAAGLEWEPKEGDYCYFDEKRELLVGENLESTKRLIRVIKNSDGCYEDMMPIFDPSLSQLLAEIERRGYRWEIAGTHGLYRMYVTNTEKMVGYNVGYTNTPEEAAGQALLLILEQGR